MSAPAKKSSADDKDMENDTWNFKSMTEDDPMDFGFGSPAKNSFKLDMGFDLDGDFGNMSSFKMDMPGFDFSSPAKKTTKTKESSEVSDDKSSGKVKQKKDLFSSFYDFDSVCDKWEESHPPLLGKYQRKPKATKGNGPRTEGKGKQNDSTAGLTELIDGKGGNRTETSNGVRSGGRGQHDMSIRY